MPDELDRSVDDIQIGEVEGWRICGWNGTRLKAYANAYEWVPGENEAICTAIGSYTEKVYKNKPDGSGVELVEVVNHTAIPDPDCMCGFWMYKSAEGLLTKGPGMHGGYSPFSSPYGIYGGRRSAINAFGGFAPAEKTGFVVVQTKGWGRVVEGADGWRCEKAAITAIVDTGDDFLQELADYYNVPLVQPPEGMDNNPDVVEGTVTDVSPKVMGRSGKARPSTVSITEDVTTTTGEAGPSKTSEDNKSSSTTHTLKVWPDNATYRSLSLWLGKRVKVYTRQQHSRYGSDRFIHRAYLQDSSSQSESQD